MAAVLRLESGQTLRPIRRRASSGVDVDGLLLMDGDVEDDDVDVDCSNVGGGNSGEIVIEASNMSPISWCQHV